MNSKKVGDRYLISDIDPVQKAKKGLMCFECEEIVLGQNLGTRLSVNLPNTNSFIYEGIKNANGKKR